MKKLLAALLLAAPLMIHASGLYPDCTSPTMSWATVSASGFLCENQDKIYSNFMLVSGTLPDATQVAIGYTVVGADDYHNVLFSYLNGFVSAFSISYQIQVDALISPQFQIVNAALDLTTGVGSPSITETVASWGSMTANQTSGRQNLGTGGVLLNITDTYNPGAGYATQFANYFTESATPEPTTVVMTGIALLAVGLVRRRKK